MKTGHVRHLASSHLDALAFLNSLSEFAVQGISVLLSSASAAGILLSACSVRGRRLVEFVVRRIVGRGRTSCVLGGPGRGAGPSLRCRARGVGGMPRRPGRIGPAAPARAGEAFGRTRPGAGSGVSVVRR
jgi:hypothetical protein